MFKRVLLSVMIVLLQTGAAAAREEIRIVGSAGVLPYMQTVAESFGRNWDLPAPSLEITGTGNGFRLFCAGVGYQTPDIIVTPRPILESEFNDCTENGAADITEIVFGLDAVVVVHAKEDGENADFQVSDIFSALAERVESDGKLIPNPFTRWSEINPELPKKPIRVTGPPQTAPEYDAFLKLIMETGCKSVHMFSAMEPEKRYLECRTLRKDGAFVEGAKTEIRIMQWLKRNPEAFGIVGYALMHNNGDRIEGNRINGVAPNMENISAGYYPLARPIYLYVKNKHVEAVEGLQQLLYEVTSERAISPDGYLADTGFIPLSEIGRNKARDRALSLETMEHK